MTRQIILALIYLCLPGRADAEQLPPCVPINSLQMHVQHKSEPVFMNIFKAQALAKDTLTPAPSQAKVLEHILKGKPCQTPGLIRFQGKCYTPKNLGLVKK